MKQNTILVIASLLSTLLFSIHVTDDIIRGMSAGGSENIIVILIMVVFLGGTLLLADRPLGRVIMLLGGLAAASMPILHMRGASYAGQIAKSSGGFLFIWTVLALGTTGTFSVILSLNGLWNLRRGQAR
ncbi:MAG TPA: hypothetical protein VLV78_12060 [Thermoanaerobaculia bacterium]|nr:hypothetical protein [Thermoanaerobaculia bacterium]